MAVPTEAPFEKGSPAMNKIVLAVDGSDHSTRAAEMAGSLSQAMGAPVDVVHVVSDGSMLTAGPIQDYARLERIVITQRELLESIGAGVVAEAAGKVRALGGTVGATKVLVGSPAHQIAEYAGEAGADCIVMGRRGLGDISGLLMGSVSHKVGHLTGLSLVTTE
ncbi:MAG TPA: universal stress protein [Acidimicrobiia bacterium]